MIGGYALSSWAGPTVLGGGPVSLGPSRLLSGPLAVRACCSAVFPWEGCQII